MRFLITINSANAKDAEFTTHQMIADHPANDVEEICNLLNECEFIVFHVFYRRKNLDGTFWWQDRGRMILNTSWITKIQEYIDLDAEDRPRRRL